MIVRSGQRLYPRRHTRAHSRWRAHIAPKNRDAARKQLIDLIDSVRSNERDDVSLSWCTSHPPVGVCAPPPRAPRRRRTPKRSLAACSLRIAALKTTTNQRRGKKALVLDPTISGPLSLLDAGLSELLTEHGVVK